MVWETFVTNISAKKFLNKNLNKNSSRQLLKECHFYNFTRQNLNVQPPDLKLFCSSRFHIEFLEFPSILSIHPIHEFDMVVESPLKKQANGKWDHFPK